MARKIPEHDYDVSELDELKMYAVTYQYQRKNGTWYVDTIHAEGNDLSEALESVADICNALLESGKHDAYEITNINVIRR